MTRDNNLINPGSQLPRQERVLRHFTAVALLIDNNSRDKILEARSYPYLIMNCQQSYVVELNNKPSLFSSFVRILATIRLVENEK